LVPALFGARPQILLVNPAEGDVLRAARGADIRVDDGGFEPIESAMSWGNLSRQWPP
jgi:hypothetical protein